MKQKGLRAKTLQGEKKLANQQSLILLSQFCKLKYLDSTVIISHFRCTNTLILTLSQSQSFITQLLYTYCLLSTNFLASQKSTIGFGQLFNLYISFYQKDNIYDKYYIFQLKEPVLIRLKRLTALHNTPLFKRSKIYLIEISN